MVEFSYIIYSLFNIISYLSRRRFMGSRAP